MSGKEKVVKFRKRRTINIGIIVFLIMFLYIAINVYIYFTKEHISIYEVQAGTTSQDNLITGLVLRQEKIIYSDQAGYISYFKKEGARVSKNSSVFAVDESRQILDVLTDGENPITLTSENNAEVKHDIRSFQTSFSDENFTYVYDFKDNAQSTVLNILNNAMIEQGPTIGEDTGLTYSYNMVNSLESGIISYYIDSFETVTADSLSMDMFQNDTYKRTNLRTTDMVTQNSPIYKLVTSESWSIAIPLTLEQYGELTDKEQINFTILKNDFETTAKLSLLQRGSDYLAILTMDKNMANYLDDRYLEIELNLNAVKGLKIPLTSIIEKDFYVVPLGYFTLGADSGNKGLLKEVYSETGEVNTVFVPTEIYYQDDTNGYVDAKLFPLGTTINLVDSVDTYRLTQMDKLTGVYNVNMGYAVFKRIEILYQNEEYCIVKKDTSYGLSTYDHIALDGKTAVEQKIIY